MIFNNVWSMPNKNTYTIRPIKELLEKYVPIGDNGWIDPMSGYSNMAEYTNDKNPDTPSMFHLDADIFLNVLRDRNILFNGILFDPPYSPRQVSEMYKGFGGKASSWDTTMSYYSKLKDNSCGLIKHGGYAISFGWNSNGFGKGRGFETIEILLVKHGGWHNDTIVTVEIKK